MGRVRWKRTPTHLNRLADEASDLLVDCVIRRKDVDAF